MCTARATEKRLNARMQSPRFGRYLRIVNTEMHVSRKEWRKKWLPIDNDLCIARTVWVWEIGVYISIERDWF